MRFFHFPYSLFTGFVLLLGGCKEEQAALEAFHFTQVPSAESGIRFNNLITESDSVNVYENEYMYNGSGVGVGDFNNDGLTDVFFTGSTVSSKLYLNKGAFQFEDITTKAGVQTAQWCTGVSVVDINADGFLDIYVSSSHLPQPERRKNLLFINDGPSSSPSGKGRGDVHFTEMAEAYGLADTGYATQAAFFDYDKDGDLDAYLLNHRLFYGDANSVMPIDTTGDSPAADKLFRNDGVAAGTSHPRFTNVSKEAGIKEDGYGLGVVVTDANGDNWPDVYVANDYLGNDKLWLNNGNGTFTNTIATSLKHQSYNSMGVDAADINNDGLPDLAVLDMMPETNERKKMMFNAASQEKYDMGLRMGYQPSFVRNMLQLNNGVRKTDNSREPYYSEIGQAAGISETDWSWSVLMADFDNDGWKDMHITNGLQKDVTNNDYAAFRSEQANGGGGYNFTGSNGRGKMDKATIAALRKNLDSYGSISVDNYFYHNEGDLTFRNTTTGVGLSTPSVSNGAAYADLDNDGDLDLLVNNMNQEAFVWKNNLRASANDTAQNFLSVQLRGEKGNSFGVGAKLYVYNRGQQQVVEQAPVRGFSSSVDYRLHIGLGRYKIIDSVKIIWPDNRVQVLNNIAVNTVLLFRQADAKAGSIEQNVLPSATLFSIADGTRGLDFQHTENSFFDFGNRRPLPQKYSQMGPCTAAGDMNGDGLEDVFVGGAANQSGRICLQQKDGAFSVKNLVEGEKPEEDLGAFLFDADGDKDLDLLITGGSQEFSTTSYNAPRFYLNNGSGAFTLSPDTLPGEITDITKEAAIADYDGDGDPDLFIGGRLSPFNYPRSPRSYLLQNHKGKFTDVTASHCPELQHAGLLTGASFTDFTGDGQPDLVICGEWMPVRFFRNNAGIFTDVTGNTGFEAMTGQWRSLQAADMDSDGDTDFVAGNLGLNTKFKVSQQRPLTAYAGDFDANGSFDLITAYYIKAANGVYDLFPSFDRAMLADQVPSIRKKYLLSADFARENMNGLLANLKTDNMLVKTCKTTTSVWIENKGGGRFTQHILPMAAQLSPINSILAEDLDGDGIKDLLLAGNEYSTEYSTGRYDASFGTFLKGGGKGVFTVVSPSVSGFLVDGDVRGMSLLKIRGAKTVLVARNNDKLQALTVKEKQRSTKI